MAVSAFITINCVDRDASADFYQSVFGVTLDPDQDFNLGGFVYRIASLRIILLHNAAKRAGDSFPLNAMNLLTVEVSDIHDTYQRALVSSGTVIEPPDADRDSMLLTDPDGITIEVLQSHAE